MRSVGVTRLVREAVLGAALLGSGPASFAVEPAPIAPPIDQLSADCNHSVYATDQLVCADRDLRALDRDVAEKATQAQQRYLLPEGAWFEDQQAWFKRRSLCAFQLDHRGCAAAAYRTRLFELDGVLSPPPMLGSLRCGADLTWRASRVVRDSAIVVSSLDGKTILVAFPPTSAHWSGFVTYRHAGRQIIFHRRDGTRDFKCRLDRQGR